MVQRCYKRTSKQNKGGTWYISTIPALFFSRAKNGEQTRKGRSPNISHKYLHPQNIRAYVLKKTVLFQTLIIRFRDKFHGPLCHVIFEVGMLPAELVVLRST